MEEESRESLHLRIGEVAANDRLMRCIIGSILPVIKYAVTLFIGVLPLII